MICKNCKNKVEGKFCSNCGQSSKVRRIDLSNFVSEVSESVFQINKGFFYTLRELSVRPGGTIDDYLIGKRKNHFKPIAYVLALSTVYFLLTKITGQSTWVDDVVTGWVNGANGQKTDFDLPKATKWFAKNYAYATLILLPVFSLASYLAFFKSDKNYLEHIVANSYITGHQAIIYAVFATAGFFIESEIFEFLPVVVACSYTLWVYNALFGKGRLIGNLLRTVLTYLLYLIFSTVLLGVLAGVK